MEKETTPGDYRQSYIDDDEIDLFELFRTIMAGWRVWVCTTLLALSAAFAYNTVTPKHYKASMTFFIPAGNSTSSAIRSYAALLGTSTPSNIEDQLLAIAESQRIRLSLTKDIEKEHPSPFQHFEKQQKHPIPADRKTEIFANQVLLLDKALQANKSKAGLFTLTYEYTDPVIAKRVIQLYLSTLSSIYEELELSSERDIIKVLDAPQVSIAPVKPKKALNLALAFIVGGGIGVLIVLMRVGFQNHRAKP